MNISAVEKIANAVMYEGYVLYPYRPSAVKNRQRFNFGVLWPRDYCDLQFGAEAWEMRTECLLEGSGLSMIEVRVRFLQLTRLDGWQGGHERDVSLPPRALESLGMWPVRRHFAFEADEQTLAGELELNVSRIGENLFRVTLWIRNLVAPAGVNGADREQVLMRSLVSVHSILHVVNGQFVSLIDPPDALKIAAAECRNVGAWPVLAGEEGQRDLMLAAPIILYDYPRIAPESAGDLCDGTEIDEILALRILTLTDEEKLEVRNGDERARRILERTEALPPDHFRKLHGAMRSLDPSPEAAR